MANMGPLTTDQDLQKMGITLQEADTAFRAAGTFARWMKTVDDDGLHAKRFLLGQACIDVLKGTTCYNTLLQPWKKAAEPPGRISDTRTWITDFKNFNSADELDDSYTRNHSLTESTDYSLTAQLSVTSNASMSIEGLGELGISITADVSEVHSKNTSETTTHDSAFNVKVPGGQGRRVTESLVQTTQQAIYECRVGITGCLAVEYGGTDTTKRTVVGSDPRNLFPGKYTSGFVTQTTKSTSIAVTIDQIDKDGNIIGPPAKPSVILSDFTDAGIRPTSVLAPAFYAVKVFNPTTQSTPNGVAFPLGLVPNKQTQPYSVAFSGDASAMTRDHLFHQFQNKVHLQFVSKPNSVYIQPKIQHGDTWSSGIDYDSKVLTAAKVKSALHTASMQMDWADEEPQLRFSH